MRPRSDRLAVGGVHERLKQLLPQMCRMSSTAAAAEQLERLRALLALGRIVAEQEATEPRDELEPRTERRPPLGADGRDELPQRARGAGVRRRTGAAFASSARRNGRSGEELREGGLDSSIATIVIQLRRFVQHLQVERVQQRDGRLSVRRRRSVAALLRRGAGGGCAARTRAAA